jgi:calcium/proton exchanger
VSVSLGRHHCPESRRNPHCSVKHGGQRPIRNPPGKISPIRLHPPFLLLNVVEILGTCFTFAGYGKDRLVFNMDVTGIMSSLMIVASASLVVPSALYSTFTPSKSSDPIENVLVLSHITSIILLIFYIMYLYFQLKSHAHLFSDSNVEADERRELGPWAASIVLILATVGVTVCSDYLVDSIDGVVKASHVSRAFIGMIIVPIVGNAGEYATTVNAAMKGRLNLAIGIVVGATLQIALFVTPFLVILGWIIGQPMSLRFDTFETTVFFLAVIVVNCLIQDGQTNYFEGAMLIAT